MLFTVEMFRLENLIRKDEFYSRANILSLTIALLYEAWKFDVEVFLKEVKQTKTINMQVVAEQILKSIKSHFDNDK